MAYVESHQELGRHPKTKKFARLLGVSVPAAIGHLHLIWWWALDFAEDGSLARYDDEEIAEAALWDGGDARAFVAALVSAGFMDRGTGGALAIHDWADYTERLITQRKANAARQKAWRDRQRGQPEPLRTADVTVTSPLRNGANVTYPNVPDQREDATASSSSEVVTSDATQGLTADVAETAQTRNDTSPPSDHAPGDPVTPPPEVRRPPPNAAQSERPLRPVPKPAIPENAPPMQLARYLRARILENAPGAKLPPDTAAGLQGWARHVDLMLRVDKRSSEQIRQVIDFAQDDPFWQSNVLSTEKLREKFDQLNGQRVTRPKLNGHGGGRARASPARAEPTPGRRFDDPALDPWQQTSV